MSTPIKDLKVIGTEIPQSPISSQGGSVQPLQSTPVKCSNSSNAGSPMSLESSTKEKQTNRKYVEYWCKYCDKYFKHKNNLRQHERTHTNERPYSCAICGKSFKKSSAFLEHRRRHSGQHSAHKKETQMLFSHTSHQCHDCGKTFNHKGSLVKHARTHSDVKEFYCELCDKDFKHKSTYDRHKRMHSGVKKFVCDFCQKGFFDKGDFKKHILCHTQNSKFRGFRHSNADRTRLDTVYPVKDTTSTAEKELNADTTEVKDTDTKDNLDQFENDASNLSMKMILYKNEPLNASVESYQEHTAFDFSNDVHIKEEMDSNWTINAVEVKNGMKETLINESHYIDVYPGRETELVQRKTSPNAAGNSNEKVTFSDFRSEETKCNGVSLFDVEHLHDVDISKADNLYSNLCKDVQVAEYKNTVITDNHQDLLNNIKGSKNIGNRHNEEHSGYKSKHKDSIANESLAHRIETSNEMGNIIEDRQDILMTEISTNSQYGKGSLSSDENCDTPNYEVSRNKQKETSNVLVTNHGKQNKSEKLKLDFQRITLGIARCVKKIARENKAVLNDFSTHNIQSATSGCLEQCHYERNVTEEKVKTKTNNAPDTEKDIFKIADVGQAIQNEENILAKNNLSCRMFFITSSDHNNALKIIEIDPSNACKQIEKLNKESIKPHIDKKTRETKEQNKCCSCILNLGPGRCHCGKLRKCCEKKICEKCKHECTSRYDYQSHLKSHLIKPSYTCADCNRTFIKWRDYRRHGCNDDENKGKETKRQTKRSVIDHPCAYCSRIYKSEKLLDAHSFQRSLNTCKECLLEFCTFHQLENHVKEHFKCQDCGFGCISKLALERHRSLRHGKKPFKCEICKITFNFKQNLYKHIKFLHRDDNLFFVCKFCRRKFSKHSNCMRHEINCRRNKHCSLGTHNEWRLKDEAESRNVEDESIGIDPNALLEGHDVSVKREDDGISAGIDLQTYFHEASKTVMIDTQFDNGNLVETQSEALPIETVNIVHSKPSPNVIEINKIQPLTTVGKSFIPILAGFETVKERHLIPDIKTNLEESSINNFSSDCGTVIISNDLFHNNRVHRKSSGKKSCVFTKSFNETGSDAVVEDLCLRKRFGNCHNVCGSQKKHINVNETLLTETLAETVWQQNISHRPGNKDTTDDETVSGDSAACMTEDDESGFEEEIIVLNHGGKFREEMQDLKKTGNTDEDHYCRTRVNGNRQRLTEQFSKKKIGQAFKSTINTKIVDRKTKVVINECENQIAKINTVGNSMNVVDNPTESIDDYQQMKKGNLEVGCESICSTVPEKSTNFDMIYTRISNNCRASECNSRMEIDKNNSISVSCQNIAKQMKSSPRTRQQIKCNGIVKHHSEIQTDETSDDSDGSDVSSINSDSEGYEECTTEEIQAMLNNMKEKKTL